MMNESIDEKILSAIKAKISDIRLLLEQFDNMWGVEDATYRFYHRSFKVFYAKKLIEDAVSLFNAIGVEAGVVNETRKLNSDFSAIVAEGLEKKFKGIETNDNWLAETRPVIEAVNHTHYMLKMMLKYGSTLETAPRTLPSGWASVLYLYNSR